MAASLDVSSLRAKFPALSRQEGERPVAYFDGAAGSQCPQSVIDAVADYLAHHNANRGGVIATSRETDRLMEDAHRALADFVGSDDPGEIVFGQNMTSLTFSLSRALGRTWSSADEILVSRLDHDANVTPWVLAARDAGATVKHINIHEEDCTLDLESFHAQLTSRTKLVAVGYASNAVGTVNPVHEICKAARNAGALSFIDAVHFAPHRRIDVASIGCDFLACSAYKFYGPHVGILWGRRPLLESLSAYKLRPSTNELPGKWMTGTQSHEAIHGAAACVDYLASLSNAGGDSRDRLNAAFAAIQAHETELGDQLLRGLRDLPDFRLWGINDSARWNERVPTFSLTHDRLPPHAMAAALAEQGLYGWAGNHYALPLTERLKLEPDGTLRLGLLHYNTRDEVDRLLSALRSLSE